MHPELKFSTIRITTGLTISEIRDGLIKLIKNKIVAKIISSPRDPTFRLIDLVKAKSYLEDLAKQNLVQI
ncbi:MAG: hypothetical protein ACC656_01775 [Candidatus Heimdallarchaeota archaeon]